MKRLVLSTIVAIMFAALGCNTSSGDSSTPSASSSTDAAARPLASSDNMFAFEIDGGGNLIRPTGYRTWVFVGSPVTPNELNNGAAPFPEFHNVYIDPASYEHYKVTGEFREGTILIKELVSVGATTAASGNGYFQGEFIGLEATVKSAEHFPSEPGNWAYFSFTNSDGPLAATATAFPAATCNACHQANAVDDFVYTQYYPVLDAAKGVGVVPEDHDEPQAQTSTIWEPGTATPLNVPSIVPTDRDEIFSFLQDAGYTAFAAQESAAHSSRGPHTRTGLPVRVFLNETLDASLAAGNSEHPAGATAVKEMFDADGALAGWAVMIKTEDLSDNGNGWFWYEATSITDGSAIQAIGNGIAGCVACHRSGGNDMFLSAHPLE